MVPEFACEGNRGLAVEEEDTPRSRMDFLNSFSTVKLNVSFPELESLKQKSSHYFYDRNVVRKNLKKLLTVSASGVHFMAQIALEQSMRSACC